jgi:hypothetical protein
VSSRRLWLRIAVAAALFGCVLWLVLETRRSSQKPPVGVLETGRGPVRAKAASPQHHAGADVRNAAPASAPAVMDELCGVSGEDRGRADKETLEQHVARLTQHAIDRWRSALAASSDPRRQALALALTNAEPGGQMVDPDELAAGNEPSKDNPANDNLVLLAIQTGDPAIYSLAMGQCKGILTDDMASGSCQALSWEHWASIDPDDGMPWLWLAAKAQDAGDLQGVDSALAKAAAAPRMDSYFSALSALALAALPNDSAPLEKAVAGAEVMTTLRVSAPLAIISMCSASEMQQPRRRQQCSSIATTLASQGSMFMDLALAAGLADRLGFPEDLRAALKAEKRSAGSVLQSYPWGRSDAASGFRCDTTLTYDGFIDALRAAGGNERIALREAAAAMRQQPGRTTAGTGR